MPVQSARGANFEKYREQIQGGMRCKDTENSAVSAIRQVVEGKCVKRRKQQAGNPYL